MAMFFRTGPMVHRLATVSKLLHALNLLLLFGYVLSWLNPFWRWTLTIEPHHFWGNLSVGSVFTYWLLENNLFSLLVDFVCLYTFFTVVQPFWGDGEILLFLLSVNAVVGLTIVVTATVTYALFDYEGLFFRCSYSGFAGSVGATLVAIKQALPDAVLLSGTGTAFFGGQRLKVNHLPFCGLLLWPLGYVPVDLMRQQLLSYRPDYNNTAISLFAYAAGVFTAWIYLRYFQKHNNGTCGDPSPNFSFKSLFPTVFHPVCDVLAPVLRRFAKYCTRTERFVSLDEVKLMPDALHRFGTVDVERQKQKALKDLNARLMHFRTEPPLVVSSSLYQEALSAADPGKDAPKQPLSPPPQPTSQQDHQPQHPRVTQQELHSSQRTNFESV